MKKALFVLTVLIAACMICSCGGGHGGSGSDASAQKAVAVGFDVDIIGAPEKALTVTDPGFSNLELWYKATHKWASEDAFEVQGDTQYVATTATDAEGYSIKDADGFVKAGAFTILNPKVTIGYFAQGQWEFEVRIKKLLSTDGTNKTKDYAILWQTADTPKTIEYINENHKDITITVVKNIDANKTGTLIFNNITAPKTSNVDFFEVYYKSVGATGNDYGTQITTGLTGITAGTTGATDTPTATLSGNATIPSGIYAVTIKYFSATNKLVGISTIAAEVVPGAETEIDGSIENGKWQQTTFTIKGMYKLATSFTAKISETTLDDKATVHVNDVIKFTGSAELQDLNGTAVTGVSKTYIYEWRVNGVKQSGSTNVFDFTPSADYANSYIYVDCIAYFQDGTGDEAVNIGSSATTFKLAVVNP